MSFASSAVASGSRGVFVAASSSRTTTASQTRCLSSSSPSSSSAPLPPPRRPTASRSKQDILPPRWLLPSRPHLLARSAIPNPPTQAQRTFSIDTPHPARARSSSTSTSTRKSDLAYPSHLSNPSPYDIFHFDSRSVTPAEIKARYYDLVRSCHPDRLASASANSTGAKSGQSGKSKSQAEEEFKRIISAYNLLKDSRSKHLYDRAGIGWNPSTAASSLSSADLWKDRRYTRRYNPSYTGPGHDRFGWQNQGFYSNQFNHSAAGSAGWNGGNGQYTSNGVFISTLFVLTWLLAGLQYSRLSLQSAKSIERADRAHLDAARSLSEAREAARSSEGRERWEAFRRRAREQRVVDELDSLAANGGGSGKAEDARDASQVESAYGVGHGGPSGKQAAMERFQQAQRLSQSASAPASDAS